MHDQDQRPLWQANYKSMSAQQLVAELEQIAKQPHHYDDRIERKAFIAGELSLKWQTRCQPTTPIIVAE